MVEVHLLGALRVAVDGSQVEPPSSRRGRALLAWLALHPGLHARSELAARLRPDVLDTSARVSLRQALWAVRRALGPAATRLSVTRDRIGLHPGPGLWVDVWELQAQLAAGRLEEALGMWTGPDLLDGLDEDWVFEERDRLRDRILEALAAGAAAREAAGDLTGAVDLTRRWTALDALAEMPARELIRRLSAAGDRAAALATYDRLCERLRRELGLAPSAATRALIEEIRGARPHAPRPPTPEAAHPLPLPGPLVRPLAQPLLVGREAELEWLRSAWGDAAAGARRCALVAGEPGIGKTRLIVELCREVHAGGAAVLFGRCDDEPLVAYQPFVEALRRWVAESPVAALEAAGEAVAVPVAPLLPELAERLGLPAPAGDSSQVADRFRLFEAVSALLGAAARMQPVVFTIDDLHGADATTLALLRHVVRAPEPAPLLILAGYRSTELEPSGSLADWLGDIRREPAVGELSLTGLDEVQTRELVALHIGREPAPELAGMVHERTGGNPYFALELIRSVATTGALARSEGRLSWELGAEIAVPQGVKDVIGKRVRRLTGDAGAALRAASVLGQEFDVDVLERMCDLGEERLLDALDEARAAHLVTELPDAGRYRFAHPLVQEALYDELSGTRRARLHALAAETLETLRAQDLPLALLALHATRAGSHADRDKAIRACAAAAEEAMDKLAFEAALELFDRALALLREDESDRRRELMRRRGLAYAAQTAVVLHPDRIPRLTQTNPADAPQA
jgi:DNA-binding SARP family transcriptional activator